MKILVHADGERNINIETDRQEERQTGSETGVTWQRVATRNFPNARTEVNTSIKARRERERY